MPILHLDGLHHYTFPLANDEAKISTLLEIFENGPVSEGLVFFSNRQRAAAMAATLQERMFPVDLLHRDMSAGESEVMLRRFSLGQMRYLLVDAGNIAGTAARAGDRARVLINFDLPDTAEAYLSRMGDYGAFGRHSSFALNFALDSEAALLAAVDAQRGIHRQHVVVSDAAGLEALTARFEALTESISQSNRPPATHQLPR
jgi:superfamily II DNA/RNA helicase